MEKSECYTDRYDDTIWYLPSKGKNYWHRLDGPAFECANGTKSWYMLIIDDTD